MTSGPLNMVVLEHWTWFLLDQPFSCIFNLSRNKAATDCKSENAGRLKLCQCKINTGKI